MTDLKFHFDDGSEYLAHYGKKGMHWGVWDENTQEKYAANPDLIGEFAKLLNGGGGGSQKPVYKGKNPYEQHAYNQSFQDRKKMNPVEAGARNLATVVSSNAKKAKSDFDKSDVGKALSTAAGMASHPKETITNYGRYTKRLVDDGSVDRAISGAKKQVSDFAKQAHKTVSSAGSRALESGARVVDDIFGTSFSKRNKVRDARKRRRHQDAVEKQQRANRQSMAMREQRTHENAMKRKNASDQAKRDRARSNREKYDWAQSRKHARAMDKVNSKDKAKRERAMEKYKQRKTADALMARGARKKKNAEAKKKAQHYKNSYQKESRLNKSVYEGQPKAYREAQKRTDAYYGKSTKAAQKAEQNHRNMLRGVGQEERAKRSAAIKVSKRIDRRRRRRSSNPYQKLYSDSQRVSQEVWSKYGPK